MMFQWGRIILDLCGGTGSWSLPYKEAGYDVRIVTMPEIDVRFYKPPQNVYGVLAAPPCTIFSYAGLWKQRTEDEIIHAMSVVDACFRIILICNPVFYAIENPAMGTLKNLLGTPQLVFEPCDYGDPYTKSTALWGKFNIPVKRPVHATLGSKMHTLVRNPIERAITPKGFAHAFFEANR